MGWEGAEVVMEAGSFGDQQGSWPRATSALMKGCLRLPLISMPQAWHI